MLVSLIQKSDAPDNSLTIQRESKQTDFRLIVMLKITVKSSLLAYMLIHNQNQHKFYIQMKAGMKSILLLTLILLLPINSQYGAPRTSLKLENHFFSELLSAEQNFNATLRHSNRLHIEIVNPSLPASATLQPYESEIQDVLNLRRGPQAACINSVFSYEPICVCPKNYQYIVNSCVPISNPTQSQAFKQLIQFQRTYDGSQNNIIFPEYGRTRIPLIRTVQSNYQDRIGMPNSKLPQPRVISNAVGAVESPRLLKTNTIGLNMLFPLFGQFLDHDITLTPQQEHGGQTMDITIPKCDIFFDKDCTGEQKIAFRRSETLSRRAHREHPNILTAWIDGGQVYGVDKESANKLRMFRNGKLTMPQKFLPKDGQKNHISGDTRTNQNIALTSFQTLFARQHNRICDELISRRGGSSLSDQQIYNYARNYLVALLQKLTFDQFLPALLGTKYYDEIIGPYKGYRVTENPGIRLQFSTAAFRFGHSLINAPFDLIGSDKKSYRKLQLGEMFSNPSLMDQQFLQGLFRGNIYTLAKSRNIRMSDDIRNFLIQNGEKTMKQDLFSLNLQRGRDHGLGGVNSYRRAYGMKTAQTFYELFEEKQVAEKLAQIYESPDEVDLWIAITGETNVEGAILGELGCRIIGEQFKEIRNGDKYWYEKTMSEQLLAEIKSTTLIDIIIRNTEVKNVPRESSFFTEELYERKQH